MTCHYFSDAWIKLNTLPVCFGAKDNKFGKFSVPSGGSLLAIKLVHVHGYVTRAKNQVYHLSYWGCGAHSSLSDQVDVVITTSTNSVLLPPSQFMGQSLPKQYKWSKIPGYNSLSPELVLSVFSSPLTLTVTSGQVLRLWYGEDLVNSSESDNGGTSCCDVFLASCKLAWSVFFNPVFLTRLSMVLRGRCKVIFLNFNLSNLFLNYKNKLAFTCIEILTSSVLLIICLIFR